MQKVILITGASSGFGRDTTETLSKAGHRVFASMRDIGGHNEAHAESLRRRGLDVVELDVTSDASVEKAVAEVIAKAGRLDVVINNAGIASAGVSESFKADQVWQLFDVNVVGVQRVLRAVLPHLRKQRDGLIVNVGSILGRVTLPFFGLYGASKFALEALSDSYRYELSQLGIDVVLVQPSAYPTNMYSSTQTPADPRRSTEYGEIGHIPEQILQAITSSFQGANAPNPHDVAEAIAKLLTTPKGSRPARVVVGRPFGADAVDEQTAPIQQHLMEEFGLGSLTKVPPQQAENRTGAA
jgi:NAD(P)-dependent dehydrogenase (short-subunit alcohol dehydrogenase family)